jgi:hypothetical protein
MGMGATFTNCTKVDSPQVSLVKLVNVAPMGNVAPMYEIEIVSLL